MAFEPALVGKWQNVAEEKEFWDFIKKGETAYQLTYGDTNESWIMSTHFFRLKGEMFLDLYSSKQTQEIMPPAIPSHFLLRVHQLKPTLRMAALNYEWLAKYLETNSSAIRHHMVMESDGSGDARVVLTASTDELQAFVIKHLSNTNAWYDSFELRSIPPK